MITPRARLFNMALIIVWASLGGAYIGDDGPSGNDFVGVLMITASFFYALSALAGADNHNDKKR